MTTRLKALLAILTICTIAIAAVTTRGLIVVNPSDQTVFEVDDSGNIDSKGNLSVALDGEIGDDLVVGDDVYADGVSEYSTATPTQTPTATPTMTATPTATPNTVIIPWSSAISSNLMTIATGRWTNAGANCACQFVIPSGDINGQKVSVTSISASFYLADSSDYLTSITLREWDVDSTTPVSLWQDTTDKTTLGWTTYTWDLTAVGSPTGAKSTSHAGAIMDILLSFINDATAAHVSGTEVYLSGTWATR